MANEQVHICATVTTGLEYVSKDECRKKLKGNVLKVVRGKIHFGIPVAELKNLKNLRSVENLSIVVNEINDFDCYGSDILERLEKLPGDFSWEFALKLWNQYTGYEEQVNYDETKGCSGSDVSFDDSASDLCNANSDKKSQKNELSSLEEIETKKRKYYPVEKEELELPDLRDTTKMKPSFRVTCSRANIKKRKHNFTSMEAASKFGSGINKTFGWKVDLSNADIEVLLRIVDDEVSVGLALTRVTRGRRNIAHFGPTTLKSTLAYSLLHLADIQPGDVVCDPMCGGGSISIEGALNWSSCVHLCGDNHDLAPSRVLSNVLDIVKETEEKKPLLEIYQWDVCNLPLKKDSINVIVTDLPFGKKSGSKQKNWDLYPKALTEMARVCPPLTGRAVLLTQDKKVMSKVLGESLLWRKKLTLWINMGGLTAGVYVLQRTSKTL